MQQHPYSLLSLATIKGQLIFTPCPGTRGTRSFEALETLKTAGASALLTLMPTEELLQNGIDSLPEECQLLGMEWFHLPVPDDQAPGKAFQVAWGAHRDRIKQLLTEGKCIAIHCRGGSGRTSLIAAQLLIECGVPYQDAIHEVRALRPGAILHPVHVQYIAQFDPSGHTGH